MNDAPWQLIRRLETENDQLSKDNERLQISLDAITGTAKRAVTSVTAVLDLITADDAPDIRAALKAATAPVVPGEIFDRIQDGADRATELRYVERRLAEADARLARMRAARGRIVAMARGGGDGMYRPGARRAVELLAEAWYGHEVDDPYAPLEDPAGSRTAPEQLRDLAGEVTGS